MTPGLTAVFDGVVQPKRLRFPFSCDARLRRPRLGGDRGLRRAGRGPRRIARVHRRHLTRLAATEVGVQRIPEAARRLVRDRPRPLRLAATPDGQFQLSVTTTASEQWVVPLAAPLRLVGGRRSDQGHGVARTIAAPTVRIRMMPPVPISGAYREHNDVFEDDRKCDGDGAHRGQRVEPRERRRDRRTDRESHHAADRQAASIQPRSKSQAPRGRENRSTRRIQRIMNGIALLGRRWRRARGAATVREATSCVGRAPSPPPRTTVMTSNT